MPDDASGVAHDPRTEPIRPEASLGELFGEFTSQMGNLFRQEVELAKVEAKTEAKRAGRGAAMAGAGGVLALVALIMLSMALAWLLDQGLNRALSFAIVGVLWLVSAAVLIRAGRAQLAAVQPLPTTTETLKEDAQWIKNRSS